MTMRPAVKFCGMTRSLDIEVAERLSVDFIGFIFEPSSPRSITLDVAQTLRPSIRRAKVVGVFTDHAIDTIAHHAATLRLDFVQLHGSPRLDILQNIKMPVIQAFRGVPDAETLEVFLEVCPFVLIDKIDGENHADFSAIAALPQSIRSRLFLSGGLTADTVHNAIERIGPFALDVARGIESSPGIKDPERMQSFLNAIAL